MKMNTPSVAKSLVSPVFRFFSFTLLTLASPWISSTTVSQMNFILGLLKARAWATLLARRLSRR